MKTMHKFLAVVISAALAAGLLAGCGAASSTASSAASSEAVSSVAASSEAASSEAASGQAEDAKVKAEFTVTGADGESQTFTLEVTDGEKLSDALVEAGLISEEEAAAGLVTTTLLYVGFIGLAVYGWRQWSMAMAQNTVLPLPKAAPMP